MDVDVAQETVAKLYWHQRRDSIRYRLVGWLSKLTAGRIRSPFYRSSVAYHKQREADDLAKHRIPDDEHIEVRAIWAVEFYTPNTISSLYRGLGKLKAEGFANHRERPADWVRSLRTGGGGSYELYLVPNGQRVWGSGYHIDLPAIADHASATILSLTPSLTALVTCFVLDNRSRGALDAELHCDHPTEIRPHSDGSMSVVSTELRQREIARHFREESVRAITAWYRANFPGVFTGSDNILPACELSVVTGATPLDLDRSNSNLLQAVKLDWGPSVYVGDLGGIDNLLSYTDGDSHFGPAEMSYLTTSYDKFEKMDDEGFGKSDDGRVQVIDSHFRSMFAVISLPKILHYYSAGVAAARDGAADAIGRASASRALEKVRTHTSELFDALTVARDLNEAASRRRLGYYGMTMHLLKRREGKAEVEMVESISKHIDKAGLRLIQDVKELDAALNTQANLLSAHANLKLQPWVILLAIISMFASIVAAIQPGRELLTPARSQPPARGVPSSAGTQTSPPR